MGRFEAKILAAILLAAVGPFIASVALVRVFVEETVAVGVNDEVRSYLADSLRVYPEFFKALGGLVDDQTSRLAEAPEVIAVAVEAEELFGAPELPTEALEPEEDPDRAVSPEEESVLLLVPEEPADPESQPQSAPEGADPSSLPESPAVALGPIESLRASIALARALEEARRRIGLTGEVRILDEQGEVLARLPATAPPPEEEVRNRRVRRPLWRQVGAAVAIEVDFPLAASYSQDFKRGEEEIYPVYRELSLSIENIKRSFLLVYLLVLGGVVIAATVIGVIFARRVTRRVGALIEATKQVAGGDLGAKVPEDGADEISDLAKNFNHMVAEVKEGRERVLYLERISAWKEIARRLAHEIKNPLTPIRLAVQQLRSSYKGEDPRFGRLVKEVDEIVDEEIASLRNLVEEFSEFARLPDISPAPEDLSAFAQELCEQNPRFAEGVALVCKPGPPLPVLLDRRAVRRALLNLVKNAAEAIADAGREGTVLVETRAGERGRAVLTVSDDGPGIPEELREKIFEPYYTSKEGGTGLGLAIVKRTVFEHGGEISVSPREGGRGGAVFTLSFPGRP